MKQTLIAAAMTCVASLSCATAPEAGRQTVLEMLGQPVPFPPEYWERDPVARRFPLHFLLGGGRYDRAVRRLPETENLDQQDDWGRTPLTIVARDESGAAYGMASALLEAGAGPNVRDRYGLTPLHYAAEAGSLAVVELLVDRYDADVNPPKILPSGKEDNLHTPLLRAGYMGDRLVVGFLESRGAKAPEGLDFGTEMSIRRGKYMRELVYPLEGPGEILWIARLRASELAQILAVKEMCFPPEFIALMERKSELLIEFMIEDPELDEIEATARAVRQAIEEADVSIMVEDVRRFDPCH